MLALPGSSPEKPFLHHHHPLTLPRPAIIGVFSVLEGKHFAGLEVCSPASGHSPSPPVTPGCSATDRAPYPGRKLLSCPPPKSMGCSGVVVPGSRTYSAPIRGP